MKQTGPFGLYMGMQLEDFSGNLEDLGNGKYRTNDVPNPHSAFQTYILQIAPKTGLAWIKALGVETTTSVYGHELQTSFNSMKTKLAAAYGKFECNDFLMHGSIWDEPRDWMQSLLNRERVLMAQWEPQMGSVLNNSLASIALIATAIETTSGWIAIEYSFENCADAEAEMAALEDSVL